MPTPKPGEWNHCLCEMGQVRLDHFLVRWFPELSRARAQKLIAEGQVKVNGAAAKASHLLEPGDRVELYFPAPKPTELRPQEIPLEVLFQDEYLAVINKPAGLVVHPAAGHADGTLVNALLHHFPDLSQGSGIGGEIRPGIVHRIDRNTSGILLVTKTDAAHQALGAQFKEHSITRRYTGLAWGNIPAKGEHNGPIARDPKERKRMAIVATGRPALTRYRSLAQEAGAVSLFEAELFTGRTHQIRVHFATAGFPLVGDAVYGACTRAARQQRERGRRTLAKNCPPAHQLTEVLEAASRQFLHASHLGFAHPITGERMEFNTPLPAELESVVLSLRSCRKT